MQRLIKFFFYKQRELFRSYFDNKSPDLHRGKRVRSGVRWSKAGTLRPFVGGLPVQASGVLLELIGSQSEFLDVRDGPISKEVLKFEFGQF